MSISVKEIFSNEFLSQRLESLTRLVLAVAAISYAIGILVINIYYGKYGYYSFSLFRVNYAIAGLWCLIILCTSYFLAVLLFKSIASLFKKGLGWKQRSMRLLALACSSYMIWYYFPQINRYFGIQGKWWQWLMLCGLGVIGIINFKNDFNHVIKIPKIEVDFNYIVGCIVSALSLIIYFYGFSGTLYSYIPSQLGGGLPENIQLVVQRSLEKPLQRIGVPFIDCKDSEIDSTFAITDTLKILVSTEQSMVLLVSDSSNHSIVINNQNIYAFRNIAHKK